MWKRVVPTSLSLLLLAGCGGGTSALMPSANNGPAVTQATVVQAQAAGKITHVVIIVQENRTLDNLFNGFPGADTVQQGLDHNGNTVNLVPRSFTDPEDPSHSYQSLLQEYAGGNMNGFDLNPVSLTILGGSGAPADYVYGYVPQSQTTIYWQLAKQYALADRMFSTEMAPSFPGHLTLIGGQSNRIIGDPTDWNPMVNFVWGCDSPSGSVVDILNAQNQVVAGGGSPCTDFQTLGDMADQKGVTWKYYSGWTDGLDLDGQVSAYDAIKHIRYGPDWNKDVPQTWDREYQFYDDVNAKRLPQISWLTPPALSSDHAGDLSDSGPDWVAQAVNAIEKSSTYASNTAIIVTWDDSGGWYDHVVPPSFNGLNYGLRVPLLVISPFTKQGYVSHVTHDFGSVLHFAEDAFGLNCIGPTDCNADDLSDMFVFTNGVRPFTLNLQPKRTLDQLKAMKSTRPVDDDK